MGRDTEEIAWKAVAGLMVFLQMVTLAFCGYIVNKIDRQGDSISTLETRIAVVETVAKNK